MNYEKKYKESLALMVDCIPDEDGYVHVRPQDIFPELKESEDERIRRELIEFTKTRGGFKQEWITWLEKQGEQKTWSEKDKKEYKYVLKFVDNILNNCGNKKDYDHCKRCYDWLKSLKERIGG